MGVDAVMIGRASIRLSMGLFREISTFLANGRAFGLRQHLTSALEAAETPFRNVNQVEGDTHWKSWK